LSTNILQGSLATRLSCGGISNYYILCQKFTPKSAGERILKIDQHLTILEAKYSGAFFGRGDVHLYSTQPVEKKQRNKNKQKGKVN